MLRSVAFFATNLRSGRAEATEAMLVEAIFAIFAAGLIGAISQQLRGAKPIWATALLLWAGLPALMPLKNQAEYRGPRSGEIEQFPNDVPDHLIRKLVAMEKPYQ